MSGILSGFLFIPAILILQLPLNTNLSNNYSANLKADTVYSDSLFVENSVQKPTVEMAEIDSLIATNLNKLDLLNPSDSNYLNQINNYDKLITKDWEVFIVTIKSISETQVNYLYPLNSNMHKIHRDKVSQIVYASGKREVFIPLVRVNELDSLQIQRVIVHDKKDWEKVTATYSVEDIPALPEKGNVTAEYEADKINAPTEFLEKNALIILRKKSANLGGHFVLVTNKKVDRPYGELPRIFLEGIVFGYDEGDDK